MESPDKAPLRTDTYLFAHSANGRGRGRHEESRDLAIAVITLLSLPNTDRDDANLNTLNSALFTFRTRSCCVVKQLWLMLYCYDIMLGI